MNLQMLLTFQLIADAILCAAIVLLFAVINREIRKKGAAVDGQAITEFKRLLGESQAATENLLKAMDESRRILKEVAYAVDGKERRLRGLMDVTDARLQAAKSPPPVEEADPAKDRRYDSVLEMAKKGYSEKEIAERLGLTEGEISLVIDLDRKKNEPS